MVKYRAAVYTGAAMAIFACAMAGCESKPVTPPPGAPTDTGAPPTVDLGPESGAPQEPQGAPTATPDGAGKP